MKKFALILPLIIGLMSCGSSSSNNTPPPPPPPPPQNPLKVVQVAGYVTGTDCTVQTGGCSSYHATFSNPVSAGDTIVLVFWWNIATPTPAPVVSDSAADTYASALPLPIIAPPGGSDDMWVYFAHNVGGGSTSVNVNVGVANSDQFSIAALELNGDYFPDVITSASSVAANQGGSPTGPEMYSSGAVTTNHANEILVGFGVINDPDPTLHGPAPISAGPDFTLQYSSNYFAVETNVVTSSGQYQAILTTPVPTYWGTVGIITFH